jgi:ectoine hydroxylase-related dioxygenase (phytanoyl-CoA dioxygenase family)
MRSSKAHLMVDSLFVKEPRTPRPVPWHQDQPVGWYEGHQLISAWIPLDEVTHESGAIEYVRASHRDGQWFSVPLEALHAEDERRGRKPRPDIDADREAFDIIHFDTEPGDVLFHNLLILHGSPGNNASERRRRAFALRYAGDDATYAPRPGSPVLPMWEPGLTPGDPFGCDLFPQVWPPAAELRRFWKDPALTPA